MIEADGAATGFLQLQTRQGADYASIANFEVIDDERGTPQWASDACLL